MIWCDLSDLCDLCDDLICPTRELFMRDEPEHLSSKVNQSAEYLVPGIIYQLCPKM